MCTVSWLITDAGYELFCSRDEQRSRAIAEPPAIRTVRDVRSLAPRDPQGGGSWVGVNEFGLSLSLLNYYPQPESAPPGPHPSRGLLLTSLLDTRSPDEIAGVLGQRPLAEYPPFLLLTVAPRVRPRLVRWDGHRLASEINPAPPVTTSSFDPAGVARARQEQFAALRHSGTQALRHYHLSRDPRGDAYSVWMNRPEARTLSLSHIAVTRETITFDYQPLGEPGTALEPSARTALPHTP
ncbi:NRDE family protein [bacterium]|nr:NRDE family protein [bacterium]